MYQTNKLEREIRGKKIQQSFITNAAVIGYHFPQELVELNKPSVWVLFFKNEL